MPKLIGGTHSSNDNYNGDCDWAVIDMTEEKAGEILRWMDKAAAFKAENSQFYCFEFWWGFSCYSAAALDDCNPPTFDDGDEFFLFPSAEQPTFEEKEWQSCECYLVQITDDTCQWNCLVKHDTTLISTPLVWRKQVEAWAKGEFDVIPPNYTRPARPGGLAAAE